MAHVRGHFDPRKGRAPPRDPSFTLFINIPAGYPYPFKKSMRYVIATTQFSVRVASSCRVLTRSMNVGT
jgi:hypothetical protein